MPGEITPAHLAKKIFIYVRQSSPNQVRHHVESQHLQYNLVERAKNLGWSKQQIVVLDEDLGITATGVKHRQDFERLSSAICRGEAGAIMVLFSSRLARNGREWHQVLEVASIFHTLIIDRDGVFDPRLPSDQLWLGMKASFSVYEVKQLQALSRAAILNKAQRGELFHNLPAGLMTTEDDRLELDPDQRIQQALFGAFAKFDELHSIRQVWKWYQREGIKLPARHYHHGVGITWRVPTYSMLNKILTNPLYAGIYIYPRTTTRTKVVSGQIIKTRGHRTTAADKPVVIKNLFQGFISPEKYEHNQQIIANNASMKGNMVKGAAREGASLLAGLLHCGHCSRKMMVHYYAGHSAPYYFCPRDRKVAGAKRCLQFSGEFLEAFVSRQLLAAVEPLAIEAAALAEKKLHHALNQQANAFAHALEHAKYEAGRIDRQLKGTDPENHLVCRTLASRWQKALEEVEKLENQLQELVAQQKPVTEQERVRLLDLAKDLKSVWDHPKTDFITKTRLVRLLVQEVWVKALDQNRFTATIHWHGGVHTEFEFNKRRYAAPKLEHVKEQPLDLIKRLAFVCDDQQIARIFNRAGITTEDHRTWSEFEVAERREKNQIPAFSPEQYHERRSVNLRHAAEVLGVSLASVRELIKVGIITATQVMPYAPWEIERAELDKPIVRRAVAAMKKGQKIPFHKDQQTLNL